MVDRRRDLSLLGAGVAALAILRLVSVPAQPSLRLCLFYWLTHRPCPLCGMTRALFSLAKGRWEDAVAFHPLSPLVFAALIVWLGTLALRAALPRVSWLRISPAAATRLLGASAALFLVFGAVRAFAY